MVNPKIALLGAGNMGRALLGGILKSRVAWPEDIVATTATDAHARTVASQFGCRSWALRNAEAVRAADVVILAVKPAKITALMREIRPALRPEQVLVSIAAAYPMELLLRDAGQPLPIFRAMPNIPVLVEEGATGMARNQHATIEQAELVEKLFAGLGPVCWVEEDQLHAVTAVSGSGPAYIYMVIEAMIAGGLKQGLPHDVAVKLAEQTVLGAAKLVRESGLHPAVLRDQVITPGGTTITAIHDLERLGLRAMLITAIETATRHSRQVTETLIQKHELTPQE
jgi:pyrroline-5-carboxylate reductase